LDRTPFPAQVTPAAKVHQSRAISICTEEPSHRAAPTGIGCNCHNDAQADPEKNKVQQHCLSSRLRAQTGRHWHYKESPARRGGAE
jgi:hypothetical protein